MDEYYDFFKSKRTRINDDYFVFFTQSRFEGDPRMGFQPSIQQQIRKNLTPTVKIKGRWERQFEMTDIFITGGPGASVSEPDEIIMVCKKIGHQAVVPIGIIKQAIDAIAREPRVVDTKLRNQIIGRKIVDLMMEECLFRTPVEVLI